MKRNRSVMMFVDPDFKKLIKTSSAINGMTIIAYTRQIANKKKNNKDDEGYQFGKWF